MPTTVSALNARCDFKSCPETAPQRLASLSGPHRGVAAIATRGGLASVDFLRMQAPLPETADELCAVARDLNADPGEIYLGAALPSARWSA